MLSLRFRTLQEMGYIVGSLVVGRLLWVLYLVHGVLVCHHLPAGAVVQESSADKLVVGEKAAAIAGVVVAAAELD